ncbi:uncharacterized protein LOC132634397 [Lycium barbarum]|uniref:uncharacterized protein LOC132634397 n=1 Tax=Lycium barbarum TaxID=112863 RepID=UPI00293F22AD|nr:uncharacterized protein LOC132634397 [Lycium barbarum]
MDPSKKLLRSGSSSNKIRQIVRLQQLLKKWKKIAAASPSSTHLQLNSSTHVPLVANNTMSTSTNSSTKSINKFLKKTLSFSEKDKDRSDDAVPKGCLAVCVGKEDKEELMKRFVIPMDYLTHQSFQVLLREAEEEFGFQQQGVLKIPCEVSLFEDILKIIHPPSSNKRQQQQPAVPHHDDAFIRSDLSTSTINDDNNIIHNVGCCSPENHQHIMSPQLCS